MVDLKSEKQTNPEKNSKLKSKSSFSYVDFEFLTSGTNSSMALLPSLSKKTNKQFISGTQIHTCENETRSNLESYFFPSNVFSQFSKLFFVSKQ